MALEEAVALYCTAFFSEGLYMVASIHGPPRERLSAIFKSCSPCNTHTFPKPHFLSITQLCPFCFFLFLSTRLSFHALTGLSLPSITPIRGCKGCQSSTRSSYHTSVTQVSNQGSSHEPNLSLAEICVQRHKVSESIH